MSGSEPFIEPKRTEPKRKNCPWQKDCHPCVELRRKNADLIALLREVLASSKWKPHWSGSQSGGEFVFAKDLLTPGCLARVKEVLKRKRGKKS